MLSELELSRIVVSCANALILALATTPPETSACFWGRGQTSRSLGGLCRKKSERRQWVMKPPMLLHLDCDSKEFCNEYCLASCLAFLYSLHLSFPGLRLTQFERVPEAEIYSNEIRKGSITWERSKRSTLKNSKRKPYDWHKRPACRHHQEDAQLMQEIRQVFVTHRGRYGSPRIQSELRISGATHRPQTSSEAHA
jgi:hypothetical protein